jgi:hypothetical protein
MTGIQRFCSFNKQASITKFANAKWLLLGKIQN